MTHWTNYHHWMSSMWDYRRHIPSANEIACITVFASPSYWDSHEMPRVLIAEPEGCRDPPVALETFVLAVAQSASLPVRRWAAQSKRPSKAIDSFSSHQPNKRSYGRLSWCAVLNDARFLQHILLTCYLAFWSNNWNNLVCIWAVQNQKIAVIFRHC